MIFFITAASATYGTDLEGWELVETDKRYLDPRAVALNDKINLGSVRIPGNRHGIRLW